MSSGPKVPRQKAIDMARTIISVLLRGTVKEAMLVGSARREREWVGDVEIAVIPVIEQRSVPTQGGLFGGGETAKQPVNTLLERLQQCADAGEIVPHDGREFDITDIHTGETAHFAPRKYWGGDLMRRFHLATCIPPVELFLADEANWGPTVAIRTGPVDFSKMLVCELRARGVYEQKDGYVRYLTGKSKGEITPCTSEADYFSLCGLHTPILPHAREAFIEGRARR